MNPRYTHPLNPTYTLGGNIHSVVDICYRHADVNLHLPGFNFTNSTNRMQIIV